MRDGDIRAALYARLAREHPPGSGTTVVDELGLCGAVRVDVAVVNGSLSAYELKSDRDTLRRLPLQVEVYSQVFDHATLVVGERHHAHARWHDCVPDWWGVLVASESRGRVTLEMDRVGEANDCIDRVALAQLLWRDEVLAALRERGLDKGMRGKPRHLLSERLAHALDTSELRALVRTQLKTREGWRRPSRRVSGGAPWPHGATPPDYPQSQPPPG